MSEQQENEHSRLLHGHSFGGLLMIDAKSSSSLTTTTTTSVKKGRVMMNDKDKEKFNKIERLKQARRRRSINLSGSSGSAQSQQIKAALEDTMGSTVDGCLIEGSPEERLQQIMTNAKEKGLSVDKIFHYFNGGDPSKTEITKEIFLHSLERLGEKLFILTEEDLDNLIRRFDRNGNGSISLAEFKHYCLYSIPHISWKAERKRLEESGEMKILMAELTEENTLKSDSSNKYKCGKKVYSTSKLFWKFNKTIVVKYFYCQPLDIITLQFYDQGSKEELEPIYVKKSQCKVDERLLKEARETTPRSAHDGSASNLFYGLSEEEWEVFATYLLNRLNIRVEEGADKQSSKVSMALTKLTNDDDETLDIPRPAALEEPPKVGDEDGGDMSEFDKRAKSFAQSVRTARRTRESSEKLQNVIASVVAEFTSDKDK